MKYSLTSAVLSFLLATHPVLSSKDGKDGKDGEAGAGWGGWSGDWSGGGCAHTCLSSAYPSPTTWPGPGSFCTSAPSGLAACISTACAASATGYPAFSSVSSSLCAAYASCTASPGSATAVKTITGGGGWGGGSDKGGVYTVKGCDYGSGWWGDKGVHGGWGGDGKDGKGGSGSGWSWKTKTITKDGYTTLYSGAGGAASVTPAPEVIVVAEGVSGSVTTTSTIGNKEVVDGGNGTGGGGATPSPTGSSVVAGADGRATVTGLGALLAGFGIIVALM